MDRILFIISFVLLFIFAPYLGWLPLLCFAVYNNAKRKPKMILPKYYWAKLEG